MNILVVGYRNHSGKIINILSKLNIVKKITIFKRNRNNYKVSLPKSEIVYKLSNLKNYDCFFILSSNNSHFYYIKKFIRYKKKIFCEKPACINLNQYNLLKKFTTKTKKQIYFNYNLKHSDFYKITKKYINNKKIGKIHHLSFKGSNGISFKKKFQNSLRFKSKNIFDRISGNIGVHYINFILSLSKTKTNVNFYEGKIKKKAEYAKIDLINNKIFGSIFLTYSSIADYRAEAVFTNGVIKFENTKILVVSPRDVFDVKGNYVYPKEKIVNKYKSYKEYTYKSFESSVKYFITHAKNNKNFLLKDFNEALESSFLLFSKSN